MRTYLLRSLGALLVLASLCGAQTDDDIQKQLDNFRRESRCSSKEHNTRGASEKHQEARLVKLNPSIEIDRQINELGELTADPTVNSPVLAKSVSADSMEEKDEEPWLVYPKSFRKGWKSLPVLYDNPEDPLIQQFKFVGRIHYQYSVVDGESAEGDFTYDHDELRRWRFGISSKFLHYFDLYAETEISNDRRPGGGEFLIRFRHFWQLKLHFDIKKAFNIGALDGLKLGIGSREINMSYEWVTSSKRIKSIERSPIANKIWAFNTDFANPTGAWLSIKLNPVSWTFGIFSTSQDKFWADFDDGELYYSMLVFDVYKGPNGEDTDIRLASFYQDVDDNDEVLAAGVEWVHALSMQHKQGPWEFHVEGVIGDNGDLGRPEREGLFWAGVGYVSYWIFKDSLEAVVKFQYQGSEESQGIRLNSRYVRRAGSHDNIPSLVNGRGDEHYSIYFGINKLLSGHQHKIMFGIEYDYLLRDGARIFEGFTFGTAYRLYF